MKHELPRLRRGLVSEGHIADGAVLLATLDEWIPSCVVVRFPWRSTRVSALSIVPTAVVLPSTMCAFLFRALCPSSQTSCGSSPMASASYKKWNPCTRTSMQLVHIFIVLMFCTPPFAWEAGLSFLTRCNFRTEMQSLPHAHAHRRFRTGAQFLLSTCPHHFAWVAG